MQAGSICFGLAAERFEKEPVAMRNIQPESLTLEADDETTEE